MQDFKDFLVEIDQQHIDALGTRLRTIDDEDHEDKQAFPEIFGSKHRLVIPFASANAGELAKIREALTDYFQRTKKSLANDPVLVKFDWEAKEVNVTWENPKAGQEVVDKKTRETSVIPKLASQSMSIAKAITKAGLGQSTLNWWSQFANDENVSPEQRQSMAEDADKFSIIISRHPIDIIRMSDAGTGTSCHAPGRSYFKCARQEAIDGGAIAYLVNTEDLEGVDLDGEEIFEDDDRNQDRNANYIPKAITRLRIRKFHSKFKDSETRRTFDFAVPEDISYGVRHPSFIPRIAQWIEEQQADLVKRNGGREQFRIKNFVLRGGSYRDSGDATLFNDYFGDDLDSGDTSWSWEGQEMMGDLLEQRRAEMEEINKEYNGGRGKDGKWTGGKFKHSHTSYYEYDYDDEGDGAFNYSLDGGVNVVLYGISLKKEPTEQEVVGHYRDEEGTVSLLKYLSDYDFDFSRDYGTDVHYKNKTLEISLRLSGDNYTDNQDENGMHPDNFSEFSQMVFDDYDQKYDDILNLTKQWLITEGFTGDVPVFDLLEKVRNKQLRFAHFEDYEPSGNDAEDAHIVVYIDAEEKIKIDPENFSQLKQYNDPSLTMTKNYQYSLELAGKMIKRLFTGAMQAKHTGGLNQLGLMDPKFYDIRTDDPNPKKGEDPRQKWFNFGIQDPDTHRRYEMSSLGVPTVELSFINSTTPYAKIKVGYAFSTNDTEESINAALQNIKVYDRNWNDLIEQAKNIFVRMGHIRKFGRGNYPAYNQNMQAQLLGAKPKMTSPRDRPARRTDYGDEEKEGFFTYTGELPYRDYGKWVKQDIDNNRKYLGGLRDQNGL